MTDHPSVGVVLPTRARPQQALAAARAILAQDYPGELRLAVVCDGQAPEFDLETDDRVGLLANRRTPGLAGARNTGALALTTDLIAFCDDDDVWLPGKLRAQVNAMRARTDAHMASCGILVRYDGRSSPRLIGRDMVSYDDLVRSRMVMVHSSTYLLRREALLDGIGLFDERIPHAQNEDWDLALRAARQSPIAFVDQPLVQVTWGDGSYFARNWQTRVEGLLWILERHPDLTASNVGAARIYAQLAFAYACLGERDQARLWTGRALRRNWHERRIPFVLAVMAGIVSGDSLLHVLHRHGHGI